MNHRSIRYIACCGAGALAILLGPAHSASAAENGTPHAAPASTTSAQAGGGHHLAKSDERVKYLAGQHPKAAPEVFTGTWTSSMQRPAMAQERVKY
ncbi:hypothetical protein [Streptomyces boncukensis]|uniref:Uncharacterized protein n=1 Tax=Streptomyces boncukensis TaxID=2711219 RepID=A0A6G4X5D7_9ACTN|nr:hypothetical protein [Streptomyces boncukensis]NGO72608.1 hypothetical protein [Streptomyces boncukensis]